MSFLSDAGNAVMDAADSLASPGPALSKAFSQFKNPFDAGGGLSYPPMSAEMVAAQKSLGSDAGQLEADAAQMRGIADPLFKAFQSGTLTPGQQAEYDLAHGGGQAANEQFLASAGIGTSSFGAGMRADLELKMAALKENFLQGDFTEAMSAMGLSAQELGIAGNDLGAILGVGAKQQAGQFSADLANQQQQNFLMQELLGLGVAGGNMATMAGTRGAASGGGGGGGTNYNNNP